MVQPHRMTVKKKVWWYYMYMYIFGVNWLSVMGFILYSDSMCLH